jgi:hypothetical protein
MTLYTGGIYRIRILHSKLRLSKQTKLGAICLHLSLMLRILVISDVEFNNISKCHCNSTNRQCDRTLIMDIITVCTILSKRKCNNIIITYHDCAASRYNPPYAMCIPMKRTITPERRLVDSCSIDRRTSSWHSGLGGGQ